MTDLDLLIDILASEEGVIGIDTETTIDRPIAREVCTVQVAHSDGREAVVHCYRKPDIIRRIMAAITRCRVPLCAHFAIFEAEVFTKYGGMPPELNCTFVAARCLRGIVPGNGIDPDFSLAGLMMSEFGVAVAKDTRQRDWRLPLDAEAIEYCLLDARYAMELWVLYSLMFEESPEEYNGFRVVNDAIPAIAECNLNGLVFDREAHQRLCITRQEEADALKLELDLACDGEIANPNSTAQVSAWVAENISFEPGASGRRASLVALQMTQGLPEPLHWKLTSNGSLMLGKDYVGSILGVVEEFFPVVGNYLRLRLQYMKHTKILQAFGETLAEKIDDDGHIRGQLIPHGARTSRQSCRDPNLQQMPSEDEFRAMFKALEGRKIVQADYEQVELVVGSVVADDEPMKNVFRHKRDIHSATAATIAHIAYADFDKENPVHNKLRKDGKPVTFSALYGAMVNTVALNSGLPHAEAQKLLDNWLAAYPGVAKYRLEEPDRARAMGYSELVSGQRIRVNDKSRGPQLINIRVQGGAASVMYLALTYVYNALKLGGWDARLALCVHDEILIDCAEEDAIEVAEMLQSEMTRAIYTLFPEVRNIKFPLAADSAIVDRWDQKDTPEFKLVNILKEKEAV